MRCYVCHLRHDADGLRRRSSYCLSRSRDSVNRDLRHGGLPADDVRSNEASLKYFILGSFASAFLLYGIALIYGATATGSLPGTTNIVSIAGRLDHL